MSTRKAVLAQVARELGWRTGSWGTGLSSATTFNIDGNFEGDSNAYVGWTIWMPDAANAADQARTITVWNPTTLTVTWSGSRTDTTYTNETYILIPPGDLTLDDLRTAFNDVLAEIRQTTHFAIPTVQDEKVYRLGRLSWVRYADDVDGVFLRSSPNLVANSQFDAWGAGASAAPSGWVLAGAAGTVARASSGVARGYYGATLTRAGADTTLTQTIGLLNAQIAGESVTMGCWVRATVASRARIGISDGLTTTYSSYHTGGGGDELLTVTKALSASATGLSVIASVDTGDTSATFSNAVSVEGGSIPEQLTETGDHAAAMRSLDGEARVRQSGDQVSVELASARGRGSQLVVVSGQPYPSLSADSDSTDCPDSILIHGIVDQAVSRMRKGQARDRLEGLRLRHHQQYMVLSKRRRERPVAEMPTRAVVVGA